MSRLNVALVQSPLIWESPGANRSYFEKVLSEIDSSVNMVILPEMFTTGFTMHPENILKEESVKTLNWMQALAKKFTIAIVGSIVFQDGDTFFNRLFFVPPDGTYSQYDKKHLFTLTGEHNVYQGGNEQLVEEYMGFVFCPMICYDLRFPVWSRNTVDYDALIYVANWPEKRVAAWDSLLKARAIENMSYCLGVNRTGTDNMGFAYVGHSGVYGPLGEQIAFSAQKEDILIVTLEKSHLQKTRKALPFLNDRDEFILSE
jgi:predicted amidohydrolase